MTADVIQIHRLSIANCYEEVTDKQMRTRLVWMLMREGLSDLEVIIFQPEDEEMMSRMYPNEPVQLRKCGSEYQITLNPLVLRRWGTLHQALEYGVRRIRDDHYLGLLH
jgi:hypothetical protein